MTPSTNLPYEPPSPRIATGRSASHIVGMSRDPSNDPGPERPRVEPEILPPERDGGPRGPAGIWLRIDERDGVRRVILARPGWPTIILGLLILGLFAAVVFLMLAGVVLLWLPIVIGGIILALLSSALRTYWARLRRWAGR
jgi:hypothetical protein